MFVSFLIGLALGAALLVWRNRMVQRQSRRIPKEWPLKARPLVNSTEKKVWVWLSKVMFDQQVLIKLPVTRFTMPAKKEEADHWYKLLNGLYCTFTVCGVDGQVVGCVDVAGHRGLSMSNQTLKHTLLTQCGVRYWVVDPANLPHLSQIRRAFLGEQSLKGPPSTGAMESRLRDVAGNLHAAVSRQRNSHNKASQVSRVDIELDGNSGFSDSRLSTGWEHNSFVTPLDSRATPLRD